MQLNKKTIQKMISEGERLDGRDKDEYREITVEADYVKTTAEGSALVTMGDTKVLVGLKVGVEEPYDDRPAEGTLVTNAELSPMADREFEAGPPQEPGVELARVVDRGIREAEAVDMNKLCIEEGEKVYTLFIDIHVLNNDGNLIDASSLGAMAALKDGYIPEYDQETDSLNREEKSMDVPMQRSPFTATGHLVNGEIVWDTTKAEEEARTARVTVSIDKEENVVAMQKGDDGPISHDHVMEIVDQAHEKTEELGEIVRDAVSD